MSSIDTAGFDRLNGLLERLKEALIKNKDELTRNIAEILLAGVQDNFLKEGRENGGSATWKPLSDVTKKRRGRAANSPILRVSNDLYESLTTSHDNDSAAVGTNKIYAATLHFGAKKGEFGTYRGPSGTWKPRPIPWGDIPARPFMTATAQELDDIADFIEEMLNNITNEEQK